MWGNTGLISKAFLKFIFALGKCSYSLPKLETQSSENWNNNWVTLRDLKERESKKANKTLHDNSNCFQELLEMATLVTWTMEVSAFMWQPSCVYETHFQDREQTYLHSDKKKQSDIFEYVSKVYYVKFTKFTGKALTSLWLFLKRTSFKKKNQVDRADIIPLPLTPRQFLGQKLTYLKTSPWISWYRSFFVAIVNKLWYKFSYHHSAMLSWIPWLCHLLYAFQVSMKSKKKKKS